MHEQAAPVQQSWQAHEASWWCAGRHHHLHEGGCHRPHQEGHPCECNSSWASVDASCTFQLSYRDGEPTHCLHARPFRQGMCLQRTVHAAYKSGSGRCSLCLLYRHLVIMHSCMEVGCTGACMIGLQGGMSSNILKESSTLQIAHICLDAQWYMPVPGRKRFVIPNVVQLSTPSTNLSLQYADFERATCYLCSMHEQALRDHICVFFNMLKADWLQIENFGAEMTPIGRAAQPKEYGPPAVFLAHEPSSSNIVACILNVTGGMLM